MGGKHFKRFHRREKKIKNESKIKSDNIRKYEALLVSPEGGRLIDFEEDTIGKVKQYLKFKPNN